MTVAAYLPLRGQQLASALISISMDYIKPLKRELRLFHDLLAIKKGPSQRLEP